MIILLLILNAFIIIISQCIYYIAIIICIVIWEGWWKHGTTLKGLKTERGLGLCAQIAFSEIDLTEDEEDYSSPSEYYSSYETDLSEDEDDYSNPTEDDNSYSSATVEEDCYYCFASS